MSTPQERILSHACDLYLEVGKDGFSMRKLAARVGVTAPALYRHYPSREHVFADVMREAYREFTAKLYRALEARTPWDRFVGAGQAYLDFALGHTRWYGVMFDPPEAMGMEGMPEDIEAMGCAIHQFWVDRVRECMDEQILVAGDPAQVSLTMWAHAHGLVHLYQRGHFRLDEGGFRTLFDDSCARMMAGLATDAFVTEAAAGGVEVATESVAT